MIIPTSRWMLALTPVRAVLLGGLFFSPFVSAQDAANAQVQKTESAPTAIEVFKGPQFKNVVVPPYPLSELNNGVEGWVDVGFMVDPQGKPYELTVLDASGDNKGLKTTALRAVEKWTFEPATLNGQPIDSSLSRKIVFRISDQENGANPKFVKGYRDLQKAISAKDRVAADGALAKMNVQNLYEDAYYGIAQFGYATVWGEPAQQLAGVRRAIAGEESAKYLPKELFAFALQQQLRLELQSQDFAMAMYTWNKLQRAGVDKTVLDLFRPSIEQVRSLRTSNRTYKVSGRLDDGSWDYILYKRKFQIDVIEGRLSQIKLRCNKAYVFFQYDPTMVYEIAEKYGTCSMELVGDANTKIDLKQM